MGRSLYGLIRASGFSGVSGQGFVNHVNPVGAKVGVKMTDYILSSFTHASGGPDGSTYSNGAVLSTVMNLAGGSYAHHIMPLGSSSAVMIAEPPTSSGSYVYGFSVAISFNVTGTGNVTVTQTLTAPIDAPLTISAVKTSETSPAGADEREITYQITKGAGSGGTANVSWQLVYFADAGEFNPTFEYLFEDVPMNKRADTGNWDWEIYTDSGYTMLYDTGVGNSKTFFAYTYPGETVGPFYCRGRPSGTAQAWRTTTAASYTDPR
jgi:hypothetical protein